MKRALIISALIVGGMLLPMLLCVFSLAWATAISYLALIVAVVCCMVASVYLHKLAGYLKRKCGIGFAAFVCAGLLPPPIVYGLWLVCRMSFAPDASDAKIGNVIGYALITFVVLACVAIAVLILLGVLVEHGIEHIVNRLLLNEKHHLHNEYLDIEDAAPLEETVDLSSDKNTVEVDVE